MTNNTTSLISLLDAVAPTVQDIAGEGHFPEKDRLALDDLNYYIQKAQHLASQPRVKRLLDNWNGQRLVQPQQRPELEDLPPLPKPPTGDEESRSQTRPRVIAYVQQTPGSTVAQITEAVGGSRRAVEIALQNSKRAGIITSRGSHPALYYSANEGVPASKTATATKVPHGERLQAVIEYVQAHPGAVCEDVAVAIGLSRSGTLSHLRAAVNDEQITIRNVGRAVEYHPVTDEVTV